MIEQKIHVVFTIDKNYAQHCAVALASLFFNNASEDFYIHIITDEPDASAIVKLKRFLSSYSDCHHSIIAISHSAIRDAPVTHHISLATYFRLFIPETLPTELDRVLFIDSDIIIRHNIRSLWEIDLDGCTHAGSIAAGMDDYPSELGLPPNTLYFNAGMLLINLKAWRGLNLFERGCKLLKEEPERLKWWDQDVLNILLYDSWKAIDLTWNAQPFIFDGTLNSESSHYERYQRFNYLKALNNPSIVHFVGGGSSKPWHYYCQHPFKQDYLAYRKITPWKNEKLVGEPNLISRFRYKLGSRSRHFLYQFSNSNS